MENDEEIKTHCSQVCQAKCCHLEILGQRVACPHLTADHLCAIYKERYYEGCPSVVLVGYVEVQNRWFGFECGKIEELIQIGKVSKEVKDCCIYARGV